MTKAEMYENLSEYLRKRTDNSSEHKEKYIHFYQLAVKNGIAPFRYARIVEEFMDDYFADTSCVRQGRKRMVLCARYPHVYDRKNKYNLRDVQDERRVNRCFSGKIPDRT